MSDARDAAGNPASGGISEERAADAEDQRAGAEFVRVGQPGADLVCSNGDGDESMTSATASAVRAPTQMALQLTGQASHLGYRPGPRACS